MASIFLQGPFIAAEMAYITERCAAATVLRVHLEEPALHIHVLSQKLSQCFMKLNQERHVTNYIIHYIATRKEKVLFIIV